MGEFLKRIVSLGQIGTRISHIFPPLQPPLKKQHEFVPMATFMLFGRDFRLISSAQANCGTPEGNSHGFVTSLPVLPRGRSGC